MVERFQLFKNNYYRQVSVIFASYISRLYLCYIPLRFLASWDPPKAV